MSQGTPQIARSPQTLEEAGKNPSSELSEGAWSYGTLIQDSCPLTESPLLEAIYEGHPLWHPYTGAM